MRIIFWGTRGSLPVAQDAKTCLDKATEALFRASGKRFDTREQARRFAIDLPFPIGRTYGGNSSCVEIALHDAEVAPHEYVICDLGSGARPFGNAALAQHEPGTPLTFHVLMSHMHWDHIMGFPLFAPSYLGQSTIRIYGIHADLEAAFRRQHGPPSFPVPFEALPANIEFVPLEEGVEYEISGLRVRAQRQMHAGDSYAFRFHAGGKTCVYSTDSEHKLDDQELVDTFADFFSDADVVIFDAMYSFSEAISVKEDWGHSSNVVGVGLCQLANARHLVLFHHEPTSDDARIAMIEAETKRFEQITRAGQRPLEITAAYDGLEIEL